MKAITVILLFFALLLTTGVAGDPGTPDTVRVGSVATFPGEQAVLPVYFYNDEPLSAIEIVLKYNANYLEVDSVSMAGGRLEYIPRSNIIFRDSSGMLNLWIPDFQGWIPRGNGLMCNFFFSADTSAVGKIFAIDTSHWGFSKTVFSDSMATEAIYPQFVEGSITVTEAPPSPDSVWLDSIMAAPGQTASVNIYGYNPKPLDTVNLALSYSSNSLIYKTTAFSDTRGELAQSKIVLVNSGLRQLLITLTFSSEYPLPPGSGELATLVFDIDPTAQDETVIIDSASYVGSQPLEFSLTDDYGGVTFAPYFTPGRIDIKTTSPVADANELALPIQYSLAQNVPNPFNPNTVISYELPQASEVTLNVYNVLGQKVRTLVDRFMPAGRHDVIFDGRADNSSILASGVYFYRLKADEFHKSHKMVLIK